MVIATTVQADPRPSIDTVRRTVVPLFTAIINDDEADGGEELTERTRWSRFQTAALRKLAADQDRDVALEEAEDREEAQVRCWSYGAGGHELGPCAELWAVSRVLSSIARGRK